MNTSYLDNLPTERVEYLWDGDIASAPDWIDRSFAGYEMGPALRIPHFALDSEGPYTTNVARMGDTIVFEPGGPRGGPRFSIVEGTGSELEREGAERHEYPIQESGASLEDQIRSGAKKADEVPEAVRAAIAGRSPKFARLHGMVGNDLVYQPPAPEGQ